MQIIYASEATPGGINEDCVACGLGWAVVLDGATAPDGVDSGCVHGVAWLVRHLAAAVAGRMLLGGGTDLRALLAASIEETCQAHGGACDLENPDSPSSTVSIVREREGALDYLVLADSPVVIHAPREDLVVISDDRLAHLPGGRPYSLGLIRSLRNQPGGFWVASTVPEAACHSVTGTLPYAEGTEIGMFTDGASRLVEFYSYGWDQLFSVLRAAGPAGLIALVRSMERDRPPGHGKQHDDATAVLMTGDRL